MKTDYQKALTYACECAGRKLRDHTRMGDDLPLKWSIEAHACAIMQHEVFKQEVSDVIERFNQRWAGSKLRQQDWAELLQLIIAKPDPLVAALDDLKDGRAGPTTESYAACLREAIAARGGKSVWEDEQ